jgi:hypothetical protein
VGINKVAYLLFFTSTLLTYPLWILLRYFHGFLKECDIRKVIREHREIF